MVLTCEVEVQHWAAGRVIVRDEEGGLSRSSFRFLPLGDQAVSGEKQPVLCNVSLDDSYELTPT